MPWEDQTKRNVHGAKKSVAVYGKTARKSFLARTQWVGLALAVLAMLLVGVHLFEAKQEKITLEAADAREASATSGIQSIPPSETRVSPPSKSLEMDDRPRQFDAKERAAFFEGIAHVFGTIGVATVDPATMAPHLSRLNARGVEGLKAVVSELEKPALSDQAVQQRIHLIDYLNYRIRWDPQAKVAARQLIARPLSDSTPPRYRATTIIEKSEMIGGLAVIDWSETADLLRSMDNGRIKRIAMKSAFASLVEHGQGKEEALAKIRAVEPSFVY